jgi:EmrB/QacA subfamily drug resistance transporter
MDRKWWTLVAVCTGVFMLLLDITIVNVALPDIQRAFSASLSDLQWVIDAYALTLAALLLTSGSIADLLGRRKVFATGIVVFTGGSLLCGAASGATFLALARALQGVGGAIMFATSLALLAQAFRPRERGVAFGIFGAVTGVAIAVGPVLGGALTSGLSWRWIFFVNLPVGVFALLVTLWRVDESRNPHATRPDWPGLVLFSVGLAALVFGLIRSGPDGWGSAHVVLSVAAAALLLIAFFVVERFTSTPMFDLRLVRVPTFSGGLIAAWSISAGLFSLLTYLVLYVQNVQHYTALETGVRFLPLSGAVFVVAAIAGRLSSHVSVRLLITPGFVLVGAGLLMMRGIDPAQSWTHFLAGFILAGAGAGLINVPLASTAVGVVPPHQAGMASGINSTFRQIGIASGVAALGSVFTSQVRSGIEGSLSSGPLASHAHAFASEVASGQIGAALRGVAPSERLQAAAATAQGFADALNDILLIGAIVSFVAAVLVFVLIRREDFVTDDEHAASTEAAAATA